MEDPPRQVRPASGSNGHPGTDPPHEPGEPNIEHLKSNGGDSEEVDGNYPTDVSLVLAHELQRILHFAVTAHSTAEWIAEQLREAFRWDSATLSTAA